MNNKNIVCIEKCVKQLNQMDELWMQKLSGGSDEEISREKKELVLELMNAVREEAKENTNVVQKLKGILNNTEFENWISEWVQNRMKGYWNSNVVRKMTNIEMAKNFMRSAFENYVLRFDPAFLNKCSEYGMKKEEMNNFLKTVDALTTYYISRHYTKEAIRKDFNLETGFELDLCDFYAGLVEENYMVLLMNNIMDRLLNEEDN